MTKTSSVEILIASHIVPWRSSNNKERLDRENGIYLSPLYDPLFDKSLISFQKDVKIIISKGIIDYELLLLIDKNSTLDVTEGMKNNLRKHRELLR